MNFAIEDILKKHILAYLKSLLGDREGIIPSFQATKKDFEGDITINLFPIFKLIKSDKKEASDQITSVEDLGTRIGEFIQKNSKEVANYNVVKGFLNIVIDASFWLNFFEEASLIELWGHKKETSGKTIMVEYSSPNTNKPLHLGHLRNILLGYSVAEILKANGNNVIKANLVNDRGIHICKSMLAWKKWGNGETPESTNLKGDHLVGKYYVIFDKNYKVEIEKLVSEGLKKEEAEKKAPLMLEAQKMLRKWELGDAETIELWKKMNGWVYDGFEKTYDLLGVNFDKTYYESNTYLLGKKAVEEGLSKKVFFKKEDGSVWVDLTDDGLDQKVVLRADGTSVYITQDIGTAIERFKTFPQLSQLIYTVGNEQDYHFKVLFLILKKLGYLQAEECYHLSYGMVELPEGKMKSREGTVVDADELIEEMTATARSTTQELGKINDFESEEAEKLYYTIGMGALKYFILKVDPKKKMLFNPKESIDFNGHTGPFIQYTYARIQSLILKSGFNKFNYDSTKLTLNNKEIALIKTVYQYPSAIAEAGKLFNPAIVANYTYELVKTYNQFYHDITILKEENNDAKLFRLALSKKTGEIIQSSMKLLGIDVPNKM